MGSWSTVSTIQQSRRQHRPARNRPGSVSKLPLARAHGGGFDHNGPQLPSDESGGLDLRWIAPSEKDTATATLEKRLWDAADQFRANSGLKSQEYSAPVLG